MVPSDTQPQDDDQDGFIAVCTILGGPNGSGKSSIFTALKPPGEFVNADVIARQIAPYNPEVVSLQAGRQVLRRLDELIQSGQDFVYETTLSSHQSVDLMRRAREAGFQVGLVFVALSNPDLNVLRVAARVAKGGHDIAEPIIRRRYEVSLSRLVEAIRIAHGTLVYDNSGTDQVLLLQINGDAIEENNLDDADPFHLRIAGIVGESLCLGATDVMQAGRAQPRP
jgi:predicted ABC-type ATPase